ncbi:MAG TPA: response regulator transcription factor [Flavilitoribacter sp.]|nr:response regulator transcription factor [Flavilitoribacter sp.]
MNSPIKVFIIDDHPMVIEGIRGLLNGEPGIEVTGSATDAFAAMEFLKAQTADVVLLDINLPEVSGLDLCPELKASFPKMKVLGLSTFKERSFISRMISQGASGYVLKSVSREELVEAIQQAYRGKMYLSMEVAQIMVQPEPATAPVPMLTSREKEILALIAEGLTNNQIAERLFISPLTVDSHRKNLLAKLEVKNTAAMIRIALEHGLI